MEPRERIIVALDTSDLYQARDIVDELRDHVGLFKIGLEFQQKLLATLRHPSANAEIVRRISESFHAMNGRLMWDGKYNDIPATMEGAARATAAHPPQFFTVHASAGMDGMKAAKEASGNAKMLAVSVLTSMNDKECREIFGDHSLPMVQQFARMAREAGADGLVCSPMELSEIVLAPGETPDIKVVPGIRPQWAAKNDQSRITTPADAIRMGADYLVIGRPICAPPHDMKRYQAAEAVAYEIADTEAALVR